MTEQEAQLQERLLKFLTSPAINSPWSRDAYAHIVRRSSESNILFMRVLELEALNRHMTRLYEMANGDLRDTMEVLRDIAAVAPLGLQQRLQQLVETFGKQPEAAAKAEPTVRQP